MEQKVAVGVHVCSSLTFLSATMTGVHYGLDVSAVAAYLPLPAELVASVESGNGALAAEAALSYGIYKAAAPIRWPVTGVLTGVAVKYTDFSSR